MSRARSSPPSHSRLAALEPLLLMVLAATYVAWWIASGGYNSNPDAFYHVGCAQLYAKQGWVSSFPWLRYTLLGDSFPNAYLLLHLVLVPFATLLEPARAVAAATFALNVAVMGSAYLVLRRWRIAHAAAWVTGLALASNLFFVWSNTFKGATLFFAFLLWSIDALWSRAWWRAFALAWLSTYAYVGAPVLLGVAAVLALVRWLWDGELVWQALAATLGGVLAGLIVNPFWPDQWSYLLAELGTSLGDPSEVRAGELLGASWTQLTGRATLTYCFGFLLLWFVLLLRQGQRGARVPAEAAAGAAVALGVLAASLWSGAHLLHLFFVSSLLFLPLLAARLGPWPRAAVAALAVAAIACAGGSLRAAFEELAAARPIRASDYEGTARFLESRTQLGETVVAPWDDFPGLFAYSKHNTYVAGLNPWFLERAAPGRFRAYSEFFRGRIADPEKLLPAFFGDARTVVLRAAPRSPGEKALLAQLGSNPHFRELQAPSPAFRVFELIRASGGSGG